MKISCTKDQMIFPLYYSIWKYKKEEFYKKLQKFDMKRYSEIIKILKNSKNLISIKILLKDSEEDQNLFNVNDHLIPAS